MQRRKDRKRKTSGESWKPSGESSDEQTDSDDRGMGPSGEPTSPVLGKFPPKIPPHFQRRPGMSLIRNEKIRQDRERRERREAEESD